MSFTRLPCVFFLVASAQLLWTVPALAGNKATRFMPFLCRDAVVRESAERLVLVGPHAIPVIIVGKDTPGPRQGFENSEIARAGAILAKFIEKITGIKCPVTSAAKAQGTRIYVGADGNPMNVFPELKNADGHGFVISTRSGPSGTDLYLVGASGTGTLYATWFFLMNYADVRLVLPGEIGEVYPKRECLEIPKDLYVLNPIPDYLLRIWSGTAGMPTDAWLADTGASQRFQYHHNMANIYPPEKFGKTHPEFYPIKEGKPFIPASKSKEAWQPTFSEPAVAQRAIEYADELFTQQPHMMSVSLSVNDGLGYSEADMRKGRLLPDGSVTISDIYYNYVNTVARAVKQRWPGKFVAFFPYNLVKSPPEFKLEDNVMIFLLNEPKKVYAEWQGKVSHIGVYQWLYGMGWVIPNHWPHAMQDYLRWVRAHGGKCFKGEAYVAWAQDGAKMWVLNNLLWNVDADVDALLTDYYEHAYGKEAAPAMSRYFAQAEKIYERRRTPEEYKITYWHPGEKQFEQATEEDFQIMSKAIQEAETKAQGEANKRRVDMTARCFRWGQLYWQQYSGMKRVGTLKVASEADVAHMLELAEEFFKLPEQRERYYKEQIETLPQYCVFSHDPKKVDWTTVDPQFTWSELDANFDRGFAAITAFMTAQGRALQTVSEFWSQVGRNHPLLKPFAETQRLHILHPGAPLKNLLTNGSFEEPPDPEKKTEVAKDWSVYHNRMVNATVSLDTKMKHHGHASVTARGLTDYSGLIRYVKVQNWTRYRLSFWYRTAPQTRHGALVIMRPPPIREELLPAAEWTKYEKTFTVNLSGGEQCRFSILLCLRHGGSEKSQIWFDDVRLEMLAPEGIER